MEKNDYAGAIAGIIITVLIIGIIAFLSWGMPKYRIYRQDLRGQANLREQEWEKRIFVEQARATNDAATMNAEAQVKLAKANAEAEIERAKGAAEANRIIGDSLKGNEGYLRYLWITNLEKGSGDRIYIPTEAGMPLLEAK